MIPAELKYTSVFSGTYFDTLLSCYYIFETYTVEGMGMSRLNRPLTQIGLTPPPGAHFPTPQELKSYLDNPAMRDAMELAMKAGDQFVSKDGQRKAAVFEVFFRNSKAAQLHEAEQAAAARLVDKAKEDRSRELAAFL